MVLTLWRGLLSMHLVCWVFLGPPFDDAGIQCHALTYHLTRFPVGTGGPNLGVSKR